MAVNVIGQRMDLFAVGHALGLITVLSCRSRKRIASVWPKYCYFLSGVLCFQYVLCIGFPPAACKGTNSTDLFLLELFTPQFSPETVLENV